MTPARRGGDGTARSWELLCDGKQVASMERDNSGDARTFAVEVSPGMQCALHAHSSSILGWQGTEWTGLGQVGLTIESGYHASFNFVVPYLPPPPPPSPPVFPPMPRPPPLPPRPPLLPGTVFAAAEAELRNHIDEAIAEKRSVSVLLEPGAHIKLSRLLECDSNIKVIIFSSDERATLDGQGKSGLFRLRGGCSLTLRRLALVNGRAYNGGVVWAEGAGDVEIVDSTITDCEATQFGGGVYVASAEVNSAVSIVDTTITGVYARVARRLLHS